MASSLASVRIDCGRPAFMTTADVKLPVSWRRCCAFRQALGSDDSGQNNIALIPEYRELFDFLQSPKVKGIAQFLSSVYGMVIRSQLSTCRALCLQDT